MRAITVEPGRAGSARLEEIPEHDPREGSVLVEAVAVGVCGTDVEIAEGKYGWAPEGATRLVLGHESLGRVLDPGTSTVLAAGPRDRRRADRPSGRAPRNAARSGRPRPRPGRDRGQAGPRAGPGGDVSRGLGRRRRLPARHRHRVHRCRRGDRRRGESRLGGGRRLPHRRRQRGTRQRAARRGRRGRGGPPEQRGRRQRQREQAPPVQGRPGLARADRAWLARLVSRRERPEDFARALKRAPEDIKVVIQFSEA